LQGQDYRYFQRFNFSGKRRILYNYQPGVESNISQRRGKLACRFSVQAVRWNYTTLAKRILNGNDHAKENDSDKKSIETAAVKIDYSTNGGVSWINAASNIPVGSSNYKLDCA